MIPATVAPSQSFNTLDRVAFCKSIREKRKQLQLNHHTNGKDNVSSSTENAFLTQMLQSSSSTASPSVSSSSSSSSLSISSLLRKANFSAPAPSHRTVTSTLSNILPALLNGTLPSSPRSASPSDMSTNIVTSHSPTSTNTTDTLVDTKCSTSLPVSPAIHAYDTHRLDSAHNGVADPNGASPPRCRSYPMAALTKRSSPPTSTVSPTQAISTTPSLASPTSYLLATASSCPSLMTTGTNPNLSSASPSPDNTTPKIVRSASVKSCASDSGVSSSSPLSDNNIVHVFRTNQIETNNQPAHISTGSRKRKSLAHFYDELNKDKKFSTEATVSSGFTMPTPSNNNNNNNSNNNNNNIPYSQQEALAIGYAQYALMHTLTQQFRVNYPAAFLHAAAASGYLPLSSPMMAAVAAATSNQPGKSSTGEKSRERRKPSQPESDNNNNHIQSSSAIHDQPYRRETYQTLLESSRLLGQHQQQKLLKPVPIDLRKHNGSHRSVDHSPIPSSFRYSSSSPSTASPASSPPCSSPPKSANPEPVNDYVCIPKKLMPVIGSRINDWLERNVNFVVSLSVVQETLGNPKDKYSLLCRIWHRLLLTSMIENTFEIYVTKDLQISNEQFSSPSGAATATTFPTENDVKQIELLITRGRTLEIDEVGFNLIREVITYKEAKTLFTNRSATLFERAECQAQARLTAWCSTRAKYSKVVFFLCNIYQVKEDIFEKLFCAGSMHQSTPIQMHLQRFLA